MTALAPLVVAMGDPAGIGPEIIAKAWEKRRDERLAAFFAVGDPCAIERVWNGPVQPIGAPSEAASVFDHALPILTVACATAVHPGQPDLEGARCALHALELATGLTREGAATALVTGPVSKAQMYQIGFTHPGQTEFVAERVGVSASATVMMLAGPTLRVVPMTTHVALSLVPGLLSPALLIAKARVTARALIRDFGIAAPRLAFAGLNPHAGEQGAIGREEIDVIEPAIAALRLEGIDAIGPMPADTMFHGRGRALYDVAMCCYHDQALVPLKTLHFDEGVNVTLGLPIVRTSPDHGTAFGIAGQNRAEPGAMIAAIRLAAEAAKRRAIATM